MLGSHHSLDILRIPFFHHDGHRRLIGLAGSQDDAHQTCTALLADNSSET